MAVACMLILALAPDCNMPRVQFTIPLSFEQEPRVGLAEQNKSPFGRMSVTTMYAAGSGP